MRVIHILTSLLSIFLYQNSYSQSKMDLLIAIDSTLKDDFWLVQLDDGINLKIFEDSNKTGEVIISEFYYSPFGHLYFNLGDRFLELLVDSTVTNIKLFESDEEMGNGLAYEANGNVKNINDTATNKVLYEWANYKPELSHDLESLYENHEKDIRTNDSINALYAKYFQQSSERFLHVFKRHPNDYYSFLKFKHIVFATSYLMKDNRDYLQYLQSYMEDTFPVNFRYTDEGYKISQLLEQTFTPVNVGSQSPDMNTTSISGAAVSLEDFKGKFVLIDFWATWCPPCLAQLPEIKELRKQYAVDELEIIGVSADHNETPLRNYVEDHELAWTHIHDSKGDITDLFGVKAYPTLILIDKDGKVILKKEGTTEKGILTNQLMEEIQKNTL